jgi:predicted Kef-type K+ transport protein
MAGRYVNTSAGFYVRTLLLVEVGCSHTISHILSSQLWAISSALADILIAVAMTRLVRHHILRLRSLTALTKILFDS